MSVFGRRAFSASDGTLSVRTTSSEAISSRLVLSIRGSGICSYWLVGVIVIGWSPSLALFVVCLEIERRLDFRLCMMRSWWTVDWLI